MYLKLGRSPCGAFYGPRAEAGVSPTRALRVLGASFGLGFSRAREPNPARRAASVKRRHRPVYRGFFPDGQPCGDPGAVTEDHGLRFHTKWIYRPVQARCRTRKIAVEAR